ncbi:MAG: GyrI-like domain-containing protein [Candidatus Kerfeldbacteria bacterium]|nr:GyrI-like domain-containing protein [Candidatus Kerfeldbacteria bacterium]
MITRLPARTVLTVTASGTPDEVFKEIMPSLYGTAYGTKFKVYKPKGKKMEIGRLTSAYPKGLRVPMSKWTIVTDLEVSSFVTAKALIQKNPARPAKLVKRPAGTYAQILHVGPYDKERPAVDLLQKFIKEKKLKVIGPHEEVYLTMPGPKAKTIIQYRVKAQRGK